MAVGMCVSKLSSNSLQPKKHKILDYYGQRNKYTLGVAVPVEELQRRAIILQGPRFS